MSVSSRGTAGRSSRRFRLAAAHGLLPLLLLAACRSQRRDSLLLVPAAAASPILTAVGFRDEHHAERKGFDRHIGTERLRNDDGNDPNIQTAATDDESFEAAAAAKTEATERLGALRIRYDDAGCSHSWGTFPNTVSFDGDDEAKRRTPEEILASGGGGVGSFKACACGLLYDLAVSKARLLRELSSSSSFSSAAAPQHETIDVSSGGVVQHHHGIGTVGASSSSSSQQQQQQNREKPIDVSAAVSEIQTAYGIGTGSSATTTTTSAAAVGGSDTAARTDRRHHHHQRDEGSVVSSLTAWTMARTPVTGPVPCENNRAAGYPCSNVDLVAHLPLISMVSTTTGKPPILANDVWGWTHRDTAGDREFLVWCVAEGAYFLEVFADEAPRLLGFLPSATGEETLWHDAKVIGSWAYIGAELGGHGMQVFDLRRLLTIDPSRDCVDPGYCRVLAADRLYRGPASNRIGQSHNLVANTDYHHGGEGDGDARRDYVYMVGGDDCAGGLHVVDVTDPANPTFAGCFDAIGYIHDAQCVDYNGPDARYSRRTEICVCFEADAVAIVDVTIKTSMRVLSVIGYSETGFTHQGWLSTDHRYVVFGDEFDEPSENSDRTRTLVVDIADLERPGPVLESFGSTSASDHNQYIASVSRSTGRVDEIVRSYADPNANRDDLFDVVYQANYQAGLSLLKVNDYQAADLKEVAFFDPYPDGDRPGFDGSWSVFPYFRSGLVAIGNVGEGLFLVKPDMERSFPDDIYPNPTPAPTVSPTTDAENLSGCFDDENLSYQDDPTKDCEWVDARYNRITKTRCAYVWNGTELSEVCRKSCGRVGLGPCGDKKFSKKSKRSKTKITKKRPKNNNKIGVGGGSAEQRRRETKKRRKLLAVRSVAASETVGGGGDDDE